VEPTFQNLIAALRRSHERLASLVASAREDVVTGGSYCTDWSVAQVLSHLGSGAEIGLIMLDSAVSGQPMDREAFPAIWDRWNAKSPAQQAADCLTADEEQISRVEALTEAEQAAIDFDFFGMMRLDAAGLVGMRLSEHAIHTWDVAAAIDPAAVVAPDAVDLLAGRLSWLAERTGRAEAGPLRARLRGGYPDTDLLLDVADKVTLAPWPGDSAAPTDGEIGLPTEALLRLAYGRLDPEHTPAAAVTGDPALLDRIRAVFPGF
jgi:uncharacterized protein (TIGR03083 family)